MDIRPESAGGKRGEPKSGLEGSDRRVRDWSGQKKTEEVLGVWPKLIFRLANDLVACTGYHGMYGRSFGLRYQWGMTERVMQSYHSSAVL